MVRGAWGLRPSRPAFTPPQVQVLSRWRRCARVFPVSAAAAQRHRGAYARLAAPHSSDQAFQCVSFEDFVRDRAVPKPLAQPRRLRETSFDNFVRDVEVGRVQPSTPPALRETSFAFYLRSQDEPTAGGVASVPGAGESPAMSLLEGPSLFPCWSCANISRSVQSLRRRLMSAFFLAQSTGLRRR